jgi:type I restriction enzyme R subunit
MYQGFCASGFKGKCAIITSYRPDPASISKEDAGAGLTEKMLQYDVYRRMIADFYRCSEDEAAARVDQFEDAVKHLFVNEPGRMRLLIVVDKLLTGFDAPSATYLYIDKKMRDHGLFQAICRVNRLDGDDKDYGYIVDYQGLFQKLESAMETYTGDAFDGFDEGDVEGVLGDRVAKAKEALVKALEVVRALVEPVAPPRGTEQYITYFCGDVEDKEQLKNTEPKRVELYKTVASLARAYANIAADLASAGYSEEEAKKLQEEVAHYAAVRDEIKLASGEKIDFKQYEPDMRQLLDRFIDAKESEVVADFEDTTLLELIAEDPNVLNRLPQGIRNSKSAVAATIVNNTRAVITVERPVNPAYYDNMSRILDGLLEERKRGVLDYKEYLAKLLEHAKKVQSGESDTSYPEWVKTRGQRALVDRVYPNVEIALELDTAVKRQKPDSWVGDVMKEREMRKVVRNVLGSGNSVLVEEVLSVLKANRDYQ